jgi:hypothetical protein
MESTKVRFDFALSFAGRDRHHAEMLRDDLRAREFLVFYDRDYEDEMIGRNGAEYLHDVYSRQTRYCLVLLSSDYDQGAWTRLERESIQARELQGEDGILIPILVSDYVPPWLPATRIYFDLAARSTAELLEVLTRLARRETMALQDVRSQTDLYRALPGTTWRKEGGLEHVVFREGGLIFNNHAGHPTWRENFYRIGPTFRRFTITWTVDGCVMDCRFNDELTEFTELASPSHWVWSLVSLQPQQPPWGI